MSDTHQPGPEAKPPEHDRHLADLTVVVNGQPAVVKVNENAPLRTVISKALEETGNVGQPPENWELRDAEGELLALDRKVGELGFDSETTLFLSLKAGVAGV